MHIQLINMDFEKNMVLMGLKQIHLHFPKHLQGTV
jgi:hypothetical protein